MSFYNVDIDDDHRLIAKIFGNHNWDKKRVDFYANILKRIFFRQFFTFNQ